MTPNDIKAAETLCDEFEAGLETWEGGIANYQVQNLIDITRQFIRKHEEQRRALNFANDVKNAAVEQYTLQINVTDRQQEEIETLEKKIEQLKQQLKACMAKIDDQEWKDHLSELYDSEY